MASPGALGQAAVFAVSELNMVALIRTLRLCRVPVLDVVPSGSGRGLY